MTLRPVVEAGVGIDVSVGADADEAAAPACGEECCPFGADVKVVGARYDDRGEGQGVQGHRLEAGCPRRIGWGFGVGWGHEQSGFDRALIVFRPADDSAAGEAMADEDHVFGREGGEDFVDGMEPVRRIGCLPIALVDAGVTVELFPAGLPMAGTGIEEAWKDEAAGW